MAKPKNVNRNGNGNRNRNGNGSGQQGGGDRVGQQAIRPLENRLRRLRRILVGNDIYLFRVCLAAWLLSAMTFGFLAADTWRGKYWWGKAVMGIIVAALLVFVFISSTDRLIIANEGVGLVPFDHNTRTMRKATGKALTLAMFAVLDSTLKNQDGYLVVAFCTCFFVFLVHLMVILDIHEDIDIAGAFLSASFVILYEKSSLWWEPFGLLLLLIVFSTYKSLLFEGVN